MKRKKNMTAAEWRDLAVSTDVSRYPKCTKPHGTFSTDLFRAHIDESLPACGCEFCDYAQGMFDGFFAKYYLTQFKFEISKFVLEMAAKHATEIDRSPLTGKNRFFSLLILTANKNLEYEVVNNGYSYGSGVFSDGDVIIITRKTRRGVESVIKEVVHYNSGECTRFAINPNFLLDALSGMGETVEVICNGRDPVIITDGKRKAIIMPMKLSCR